MFDVAHGPIVYGLRFLVFTQKYGVRVSVGLLIKESQVASTTVKKYLICGPDGDWYIRPPHEAFSPEEAVEAYERADGEGHLTVGSDYEVFEVVGESVKLSTVPSLKRI